MEQKTASNNISESFSEIPDLTGINLIPKKYVHKKNENNVHIYNVRRKLPRFFKSDFFEKEIRQQTTPDEFNFLRKYYLKGSSYNKKNQYILSSLPSTIKEEVLNEIIDIQNNKNKTFIQKFYVYSSNQKCYCLDHSIDEADELKLANILDLHSMLIRDTEKKCISDILEKIDLIEKEEVYYANMYVDPEHIYFFEHQLDHISGMMIIETARQLFVSIAHLFGKAPVSDEVDFILSNLNSSFKDYLLMSYPVRMRLEMDKITYTEKGFWNTVSSNISFIQEYKEKANFHIQGIIMEKKVHDEIVQKNVVKNITSRNNDVCPNHNAIYLKMVHTSEIGFFGTIIDISPKHFIAEFKIPIIFEKVDSFKFLINYKKDIQPTGICSFEWQYESEEQNIVRFKVEDMDSDSRNNIIDIIKNISQTREEYIAI